MIRAKPGIAGAAPLTMKPAKPDGGVKRGKGSRSEESKAAHYRLKLFVTGTTPRSARAIQNIRRICEEHIPGCYDLQVTDIYQHPEDARTEQIIVTPTLVKQSPLPACKLIGDLSDTGRVLLGLGIAARLPSDHPAESGHAA